jgi:hypothetical protein
MRTVKVKEKLISVMMCMVSSVAIAEIHSPYAMKLTDKIESNLGYCQSAEEEIKLWSHINKYANSVLLTTPSIPPEQIKYIETEKSASTERAVALYETALYVMYDIRTRSQNLKDLSAYYLLNQKRLTLRNKIEIIGKSVINLETKFMRHQIKDAVASLAKKEYLVDEHDLSMQWAISSSITRNLTWHLICYGENSTSK